MVNILIDRGDLAGANGCWPRSTVTRYAAHLTAPAGISACEFCGRLVLRGMGWWWQFPPDPEPAADDEWGDYPLSETYSGSGIYE
jgi:hypothetical protein